MKNDRRSLAALPLAALVFALAAAGSSPAPAAPAAAPAARPDLYRKVVSLHWVVRDVDAVRQAWSRFGFRSSRDLGEISVAGSYRGQTGSARLRVATARIAGLDVAWIQPLDGKSAFSDFLARRGEGVFSVNYAAPGAEALEAEVARLGRLGVDVLQRAQVPSSAGVFSVVHMDTEIGGKYVLGLVHGQPPGAPAEVPDDGPPFPVKLSQHAVVVESLAPVSDYWARLGFPAMGVTHPALGDLRHRGQPGRFDQKLGWHRHGEVTWEWIEPLSGPTVYLEFLKAHGEGYHHLAFDVPDMDAAIRGWEALGVAFVQSGSWGEKGQPGSGRFAYADTTAAGGLTVELLWNRR